VEIDAALVRRLIAAQFPQWANLPVLRVEPGGWDNRTFRLGVQRSVRLPSGASYAAQVEKEQAWLPRLAPELPLAIPVPVAHGRPGEGYPWHWSVYGWLEGESAETARVADTSELARALAAFLVALQAIDATGGPPPGPHNFLRGAPLAVYDADTRRALETLRGQGVTTAAAALWEAALATEWRGAPVWLHGDVSAGNLLVRDGRLSAVLDFGCAAVGDPACDLAIAWTYFSGASRAAFREALPLDRGTWLRGAGWALWKALITLSGQARSAEGLGHAARARRVLEAILEDPELR
jgi:aminoglycoside phosphotransferase (APT) family kinase protein